MVAKIPSVKMEANEFSLEEVEDMEEKFTDPKVR